MNARVLMIAMLTVFTGNRQLGTDNLIAASWLDTPTPTSWNKSNGSIPAAPKVQSSARCKDLARPAQLDEDRRVRERGWALVGYGLIHLDAAQQVLHELRDSIR